MQKQTAICLMALALVGCGPAWAPANAPTTPCEIIGETEYREALAAGATRGTAQVREDGSVWLQDGPGTRHCSTFTSALKTCRRPNDYVIEYTQTDGQKFHVFVPANTEYRFNVRALPNHCQIVLSLRPPS